LPRKSHCPKPVVSIAFKLQSRISTGKLAYSSSTRTSRIQARRVTCFVRLKQCRASNARHSGLSNGVMLPLPALRNT
jgi:hypothetical protein